MRRLRSSTVAASAAAAAGNGNGAVGRNGLTGNGAGAKVSAPVTAVQKKKAKRVPCCMTCGNVLPPKPATVAGLGARDGSANGAKPTGKGKLKEEDCPRFVYL